MKTYSKLLIHEPPLEIQPSLAVAIGLNEALFLQQVHYWIQRSGKERDGLLWIYNSYAEWAKQFPFWSERTIRRIVQSLEERNLLVTSNAMNRIRFDKTLWYAIRYDELDKLSVPSDQTVTPSGQVVTPYGQVDLTQEDSLAARSGQPDLLGADWLTTPIPENTTEITSETTSETTPKEGEAAADAAPQAAPASPLENGKGAVSIDQRAAPLKRDQRPQLQRSLDATRAKVNAAGLTMTQFRALVDDLLERYGQLEMADDGTQFGDRALSETQDAVVSLLGLGVTTTAQLQAVLDDYWEHDWRAKKEAASGRPRAMPTRNVLVDYAAKLQVAAKENGNDRDQGRAQARAHVPTADELALSARYPQMLAELGDIDW